MDDDTFPTNKYADEIANRNLECVPRFSLMFEFFKMMWRDADMRRSTFKVIAVDQLNNLNFIVALGSSVYLVDVLLNFKKSESSVVFGDRKSALVLLMVITIVPFAILHFLSQMKIMWEVDAAILKRNLLRKFLNFNDASRAELRDGDLVILITRDADALVAGGFASFVALAASLGKLLLLLVYEFLSPIFFETPLSLNSFIPLFAFPFLLMGFVFFRRQVTSRALHTRHAKEVRAIEHVQQTAMFYRLIADYNRRPAFVERFETILEEFYDSDTASALILGNNAYFAPWLTVLSVSMFMVVGGIQVLEDTLPLGIFLTTLRVFQSVGDCWGTIYTVILDMQIAIPMLERIVTFMNLPTDIGHRLKLNRARRSKTASLHEHARKSMTEEGIQLDGLPIKVEDINLSYETSGRTMELHQSGVMEIAQGEFVALVGPRGEGKTTLLKFLGGVILPKISDGGEIFVPSHLRLLHVSMEPMFFWGTLLENLTFGVPPGDEDSSKKRVISVCQRLRLPEEITNLVDSQDRTSWFQTLSQTQRALLTIARALIANYEVLIMHKPVLVFDEITSRMVLEVFREFVREKGISQDPDTWHLRRPRTCVVTASKMMGAQLADKVFRVSAAGGIERVPTQEVAKAAVPEMFADSGLS